MKKDNLLFDIENKIALLEKGETVARKTDKLLFLKDLRLFLSENYKKIPHFYAYLLEPKDKKMRKKITNTMRGSIVDWNILSRLKTMVLEN
jgi:hypothetical protein